ncbi:LysR family transcriptional regulator [Labrys okinawensis]|uniref:LysR family transcriptional regulator n=1 Tax=Labrys okinawensis TaxID=346911 RepID=UPI0039BD22A3
MSIQRLRHFIALAEEGNFARGAERCGIRQPPFSQSIARLERDCGATLFLRAAGGTKLTPAGEALLPEARITVSAFDRGSALARRTSQAGQPVRIGLVHAALWGVMPTLLALAHDEEIPVELIQMRSNEQLQALADGRLDLGVASPPFAMTARMRAIAFHGEEIVAAVPAAQAPAMGDTIALGEIADRLVMFPRQQGPALHEAILAMFAAQGLTPRIAQETPEMMTTLALVAAGIGAAFVPASVAQALPAVGVLYRRIADDVTVPAWPLSLVHMPLPATSPAGRLLAAWQRK